MFLRPILVAAAMVAIASAQVGAADEKPAASVKKVTPDEFDESRKEKDVVVIDVRSPEEFAAGRVPGAVNVPISGKGSEDFDKRIVEASNGKTPLIYCRSGNRSARAAVKMQELGIKSIVEMPAGWVGWSGAGKEVEKGPVPSK